VRPWKRASSEPATRRIRFVDLLADIFDFRRDQTGRAILRTVAGIVTLALAVNALYGLVALAAGTLSRSLEEVSWLAWMGREWLAALGAAALALLLFGLAVGWMWLNYRRNLRLPMRVANLKRPEPHRGLIASLSPYRDLGRAKAKTPEEAVGRLGNVADDQEARADLLQSNWGPLLVALEHHGEAMTHCWLLCSRGEKGSHAQFAAAAQMVRIVTNKADGEIVCQEVEIEEPHNVGEVARKVQEIYEEARTGANLTAGEIIADFTSGLASMSAGMVLATLGAEQEVEYLRQDRPLVENGRALSREEIREREILIAVETSRELVDPAVWRATWGEAERTASPGRSRG
jgi:hypothetical protein